MKVLFDTPHLYYLPQYLPVRAALSQRRAQCAFVAYRDPDVPGLLPEVLEELGLERREVESTKASLELYRELEPEWVIFGNGYAGLDRLGPLTRSAVINHGAGVKSGGLNPAMNSMDVRFLEGPYHYSKLRGNYPDCEFLVTGFAKLDPLLNEHEPMLRLEALGLDPAKPTLLYAPTFFPSSIEAMSDRFPQEFADANIIVKLHFFSHRRRRYRAHLAKIDKWRPASNVYVASPREYSVVPFMDIADVLISDASTTLFEFAALDKPVVWCDFIRVRWRYRGPFGYRLRRRMEPSMQRFRDIAEHAGSYRDLRRAVASQLEQPGMYREKRKEYSELLLGPLDGRASQRIADYLVGSAVRGGR